MVNSPLDPMDRKAVDGPMVILVYWYGWWFLGSVHWCEVLSQVTAHYLDGFAKNIGMPHLFFLILLGKMITTHGLLEQPAF